LAAAIAGAMPAGAVAKKTTGKAASKNLVFIKFPSQISGWSKPEISPVCRDAIAQVMTGFPNGHKYFRSTN
jgi:hypothetical protein